MSTESLAQPAVGDPHAGPAGAVHRAMHGVPRQPGDALVSVRRVSDALQWAQAALVLGEQRFWVERHFGFDLATVQPRSRQEYATLSAYYAAPAGAVLLATVDDDPAGVVALRAMPDGRGELKRLYVRPCRRGAGIARQLLTEVVAVARERGLASLYLELSPEKMPVAHGLYRKLGWREVDRAGIDDVEGFVAMSFDLDTAVTSELSLVPDGGAVPRAAPVAPTRDAVT
jgi:carbonic anhydrase